jgi:hypothetical protein
MVVPAAMATTTIDDDRWQIRYEMVPILDIVSADLLGHLKQCLAFIDDAFACRENVLVHWYVPWPCIDPLASCLIDCRVLWHCYRPVVQECLDQHQW